MPNYIFSRISGESRYTEKKTAQMAPAGPRQLHRPGNSVSPAENQLAYGFKIKHTHTIQALGGGGARFWREQNPGSHGSPEPGGSEAMGQHGHMCCQRI